MLIFFVVDDDDVDDVDCFLRYSITSVSAGRTHSAVIDGKSDTALFIIGGFPLSRNI